MQANIHEAKTHFSQLIERAIAGEEVVISKNGKPVVYLAQFKQPAPERIPGLSAGKGFIGDSFDIELDPEIIKEFEK